MVLSGSKDKGMTVGKITTVLELYTIGFVVDVRSNMKLLSAFFLTQTIKRCMVLLF